MSAKPLSTRTVGRGSAVSPDVRLRRKRLEDGQVRLDCADSLSVYDEWEAPQAIVSDGAYGILGFEGDTADHMGIPAWYEDHVAAWSRRATGGTTLWFWNSEIGWAAAHPILEKHGWRYVSANVWNKGKAHIAGNVNTATIRRFPVVTEMCVQYAFAPKLGGLDLKHWLHHEWKRTGLPFRLANEACGLKDAATRKYLNPGHLWYFPPAETFAKLAAYANQNGDPAGRPYFSANGVTPMTADQWAGMRSRFNCPMGVTNVWDRAPLAGSERVKMPHLTGGKAIHLNQKPLDLMTRIIEASTVPGEVIWEPFGGLFSASLAAKQAGRKAFAAENVPLYFKMGAERFGFQPG